MRRILALAAAALASLTLVPHPIHSVPVAEAVLYDGQSVRMEGFIQDARYDGTRFVLVHNGHGVRVQTEVTTLVDGTWVAVEGSLRRLDGELVLFADRIHAEPPPGPVAVDVARLLEAPDAFVGQVLQVHGNIIRDELVVGPHRMRTGEGPWVDGHVAAVGSVAYEARCGCYRFNAHEVRPWIG